MILTEQDNSMVNANIAMAVITGLGVILSLLFNSYIILKNYADKKDTTYFMFQNKKLIISDSVKHILDEEIKDSGFINRNDLLVLSNDINLQFDDCLKTIQTQKSTKIKKCREDLMYVSIKLKEALDSVIDLKIGPLSSNTNQFCSFLMCVREQLSKIDYRKNANSDIKTVIDKSFSNIYWK